MNNVRIFEPMTVNDIIKYLNSLSPSDKEAKIRISVSLENGSYEVVDIKDFFITVDNELVITHE